MLSSVMCAYRMPRLLKLLKMKTTIIALALASAALGNAHAQVPSQTRFFVGAGATAGGDKLVHVTWADGDEYDLRAGAVLALAAGVDFRVNPQFSLQANVGYHFDRVNGSNGKLAFSRYPIEVLAYYDTSAQWRVGGGARYSANAKLSGHGAGDIGNMEFDTGTGVILEAEYKLSPNLGAKVRYVAEKYTLKGTGVDVDGNHIGFFANYYF